MKNKEYRIFFILFLIQYLWDVLTSPKCVGRIGNYLLSIHHLLSIYIIFGAFLFNPKYHLLTLILLLIHWLSDNRCFLTTWTNHYCGYDEERYFQDITTKLKLREYISNNIDWYFILLLIIYDIKQIYNL